MVIGLRETVLGNRIKFFGTSGVNEAKTIIFVFMIKAYIPWGRFVYPGVHAGSLRKTVLMGFSLNDSMENIREPPDCNAVPVPGWGEVVLHVGIYTERVLDSRKFKENFVWAKVTSWIVMSVMGEEWACLSVFPHPRVVGWEQPGGSAALLGVLRSCMTWLLGVGGGVGGWGVGGWSL